MPEFIVGIGPGKAGTTWLYNQLRKCGSINLSKVKETNYFLAEDADMGGYRSFFDPDGPQTYVEISNFYFKSDAALQAIARILPNAKIVVFRRYEVDRLLSCYKFEVKQGYTGGFERYIQSIVPEEFNNESILERVRKHFDEQNILIVDFDEIKTAPQNVLTQVSQFCRVDQIRHDADGYSNPSTLPRAALVARVGRFCARILRNLGAYRLLQALKNSVLVRKLFYTSAPVTVSDAEYELAKRTLGFLPRPQDGS